MSKFQQDAEKLLAAVGGKENIQAITHCVTRLRFVLVDPQKADVARIEEIAAVKGTFTQSGQFQVIIGNEVADFYQVFTKLAGIEGVSKDAVKAAATAQQNWLQRMMSALGEIFAPIIPALVCGGLILGFRNIIGEIAMFDGKTLAQTSQFWQGLYNFLWLIGEAVFHMLPIGIVWSITRKMGTTPILGIVLGATLVSPQLMNAFAVAGADVIPAWDFGFAKVNMIGYQGQVIAAIMAGFVLVYLERFFRRVTPAVISMIVVPFCALVPAVIIAHVLVGPIGWKVGTAIANAVYGGLTSNWSVLFAAVFGLLYAPVVMTGLHHMTNAIDITLTTKFGGTILWPMIALSNIAQGSSVLAMSVLQRHDKRAQQVNVPAFISAYLGVTEPALFGVNLKYGFPLICGMIGSAVAAVISVGSGVQALSIGVGGIPGILSINPQFWGSFALAMLAAIAVPFLLTYFVGRHKLRALAVAPAAEATVAAENANVAQSAAPETFIAPMSGRLYAIEDIEDAAFASKSMGDGIAIEPSEGIVVAPFSGTVEVVFPTGHAYGMSCDNGREILIHIGMDTVELKGEGFTPRVRQGDHVRQGDVLAEVDLDYVRAQGKPLVSPIVFTDSDPVTLHKKNVDVVRGESGILDV
ncbi:MAG: PTS system trehalose-specific EIIBC component [Cardiobacteriaceae bacterium]|nr:PTS system trehalose-specific EIIBC component [Cardiobacteriaceae bacterium]